MTTENTILVIDDHPIFAAGFAATAKTLRPDWTTIAIHWDDRQATATPTPVDLALVGASLLGAHRAQKLDALLRRWSPPRVIVMTNAERDPVPRHGAAKASASACKTTDGATLVRLIERTLATGTSAAAPAGKQRQSLTRRQQEMLALLAEGRANKEISRMLSIEERTVRAHLTRLYQSIGASGRLQAVVRGHALGLLG